MLKEQNPVLELVEAMFRELRARPEKMSATLIVSGCIMLCRHNVHNHIIKIGLNLILLYYFQSVAFTKNVKVHN